MLSRIISCFRQDKKFSTVVLIYFGIVILNFLYKPWEVFEEGETLNIMSGIFIGLELPNLPSNFVLKIAISTAFAGISDFMELVSYGVFVAGTASDTTMHDMGMGFVLFCFFILSLQRAISKRIMSTSNFYDYNKVKNRLLHFMMENILLAISCYITFKIYPLCYVSLSYFFDFWFAKSGSILGLILLIVVIVFLFLLAAGMFYMFVYAFILEIALLALSVFSPHFNLLAYILVIPAAWGISTLAEFLASIAEWATLGTTYIIMPFMRPVLVFIYDYDIDETPW